MMGCYYERNGKRGTSTGNGKIKTKQNKTKKKKKDGKKPNLTLILSATSLPNVFCSICWFSRSPFYVLVTSRLGAFWTSDEFHPRRICLHLTNWSSIRGWKNANSLVATVIVSVATSPGCYRTDLNRAPLKRVFPIYNCTIEKSTRQLNAKSRVLIVIVYSVKKKLDKFRKTFNWNALDLLACNTAFFVLAARRRHLASLPGGTDLIRGRAFGPGISR